MAKGADGIDEEYYVAVPPDPTDVKMKGVWATLRGLTQVAAEPAQTRCPVWAGSRRAASSGRDRAGSKPAQAPRAPATSCCPLPEPDQRAIGAAGAGCWRTW